LELTISLNLGNIPMISPPLLMFDITSEHYSCQRGGKSKMTIISKSYALDMDFILWYLLLIVG
jgi:hypothetical protein